MRKDGNNADGNPRAAWQRREESTCDMPNPGGAGMGGRDTEMGTPARAEILDSSG